MFLVLLTLAFSLILPTVSSARDRDQPAEAQHADSMTIMIVPLECAEIEVTVIDSCPCLRGEGFLVDGPDSLTPIMWRAFTDHQGFPRFEFCGRLNEGQILQAMDPQRWYVSTINHLSDECAVGAAIVSRKPLQDITRPFPDDILPDRPLSAKEASIMLRHFVTGVSALPIFQDITVR
ncbi:MAG: hypothetical protein V1745_00560 [Patescibacteria group bacterium]